jgi:flagellar hook protein FlgE
MSGRSNARTSTSPRSSVGLITAQRNFQANAKAIDTATQASQTIMNLRT